MVKAGYSREHEGDLPNGASRNYLAFSHNDILNLTVKSVSTNNLLETAVSLLLGDFRLSEEVANCGAASRARSAPPSKKRLYP